MELSLKLNKAVRRRRDEADVTLLSWQQECEEEDVIVNSAFVCSESPTTIIEMFAPLFW